MEVDEDLTIPNTVREKLDRTGITLRVPKKLGAIFAAAPAAYYLQANLSAEEVRTPTLEIEPVERTVELAEGSEFETDIVNLLRRAFWLDCLVRNVGQYGVELVEAGLLDRLDFDAHHAYSTSPAERLETYLESDFGSIEAELPEWHLATYVDPVTRHVRAIPHLLHKLSLIYEPRSRPADSGELLEYSLDRFHRSVRNPLPADSVRKAKPRFPDSQHGRVLGWMAEGYPVDVYKAIPDAHDNKFEYLDTPEQPKSIIVIVNDPKMEEEKSIVAEKYQQRSEELSIDVSAYQNVSVDRLATIFESETDFVHYIGHCTEHGLLCEDGNLSVSSIDESRAKTFFLNACGSFDEGNELIKQ